MKPVLLWALALLITLAAAVYQRMTGPTYPKRMTVEVNGSPVKMKLLRSESTDKIAKVEIPARVDYSANLHFRKFPTDSEWEVVPFLPQGNVLAATLPTLAAAGKYEYYIEILGSGEPLFVAKEEPVRFRFKDPVPDIVLIPHILAMFIAMLLANYAGLLALGKNPRFVFYTNLTFILLTIGGMVLGPIVQKYAFGEYWTGIPWGWDLTDNKLLVGFILFLVAVLANRKKERPLVTVAASVMLLVIYSIPHSLFGSELDHESGRIIQGLIMPILF